MWNESSEPITARRQTRLKFLEQESGQLRTYKSDLEFCLLNTKRLLSEMISAQVIFSHRRIDSSDTEIISHVPLKTVESALEKNMQLLTTLKKTKRERDLILGKVLISEQLADETMRKEQEIIQESEDKASDIKYVLDKKDLRLSNLRSKIETVEAEISKFKNESLAILPLTEDNLALFKQSEKIKYNLSKISKRLQITESHTEELKQHAEEVQSCLEQYKILSKNPMIRNKKNINLASTQILDMTMNLDLDSSDSESSEVFFPDKLQVETRIKPKLPKLDFGKVLKGSEKALQQNPVIQNKSKVEYLEKMCKEKTDLLNAMRAQIRAQLAKNAELVKKLNGTEQNSEVLTEKKKKKRAMSNTLEYLTPEIKEKKEDFVEIEDKSARISIESLDNMSSFNGSEVEKLEFQEPDSILCEYIHEINQK